MHCSTAALYALSCSFHQIKKLVFLKNQPIKLPLNKSPSPPLTFSPPFFFLVGLTLEGLCVGDSTFRPCGSLPSLSVRLSPAGVVLAGYCCLRL